LQDIRYAVRQLRKSPGFTIVALLTLALGIGANIAIFSVIEAVLLRPLPFPASDQLVWLNGKFPLSDQAAVSPLDFQDYRRDNRSFSCLAVMGYSPGPANLIGDKPKQVLSQTASANFFNCLGTHPLLGRDFVLSDEQVDLPQVAILGYGIWKRDFGGDRNVIGRTIRMDGSTLTVVGVLPSDFPLLTEAQVWVPTPMLNHWMNIRFSHSLKMMGRLRTGEHSDNHKPIWMRSLCACKSNIPTQTKIGGCSNGRCGKCCWAQRVQFYCLWGARLDYCC